MKRTLARLLSLGTLVVASSLLGNLAIANGTAHSVTYDLKSAAFSSQPKFLGYELLVEASHTGCPGNDRINQLVSATIPNIKADEPVEMFLLPPLVRFIYQFPECLSAKQLGDIKDHLTSSRQRLFGHGTINHAALRATSWYLLAQKFPDAIWTDWGGSKHSSSEVMRNLKLKMTARANGFYQRGQYELVSPTYSLINLYPYLNLYDFAKDPEIKNQADAQANLEVAALLANSFHGVILPPLTRKNYDQRNASNSREKYAPSVAQSILKYYTGEPSGLSDADWWGRGEPPFVIMLELSHWAPIFPVDVFDSAKSKGFHIHINTPGFSEWGAPSEVELSGDSYITDSYSLSAGNGEFKVDQYYQHIQTSAVTVKSDGEFNQIECYHPYFSGASDRPTWGTDRWSPTIQSALLSDHTLALIGDLPPKDPWPGSPSSPHSKGRWRPDGMLPQSAFCRIPADLKIKFVTPTTILIWNDYVTVKLTSLAGDLNLASPTITHRVIKTTGPQIALLLSAASGGGLNLNRFSEENYHFNATNMTITNGRGQFIQFKYPTIDGSGYIKSFPVTQDPLNLAPIQATEITLNHGILTVRSMNNTKRYECKPSGCQSYN